MSSLYAKLILKERALAGYLKDQEIKIRALPQALKELGRTTRHRNHRSR